MASASHYLRCVVKLLIMGAGGETGEAVVEQALALGHEVTAFVHSPAEYKRTRIRGRRGRCGTKRPCSKLSMDRSNPRHIRRASTLSQHDSGTGTVLNVIETMKEAGVRRLIVLSTIGEGESASNVHSYYKHLFNDHPPSWRDERTRQALRPRCSIAISTGPSSALPVSRTVLPKESAS